MNATEYDRFADALVALLQRASVSSFQYDLKDLIRSTKVNVPYRKALDIVSDMLTTEEMVRNVGEWVIAEIEGCKVQFNVLSSNTGPCIEDKPEYAAYDNEDEDWPEGLNEETEFLEKYEAACPNLGKAAQLARNT